jgi:hypothetical protein
VDAEVKRAENKYSPVVAVENISKFDTDILADRLKAIAIGAARDSIVTFADWFNEEARKSTNKLDNLLIPIVEELSKMTQKLLDKVK